MAGLHAPDTPSAAVPAPATPGELAAHGWVRRVTIPTIVAGVVPAAIFIPWMWLDPSSAAAPAIGKLLMAGIIAAGSAVIGAMAHMMAAPEGPLDEIGHALAPNAATDAGIATLFEVRRRDVWRWRREGVPEARQPEVLEALNLARTLTAANERARGAIGSGTMAEVRQRLAATLEK